MTNLLTIVSGLLHINTFIQPRFIFDRYIEKPLLENGGKNLAWHVSLRNYAACPCSTQLKEEEEQKNDLKRTTKRCGLYVIDMSLPPGFCVLPKAQYLYQFVHPPSVPMNFPPFCGDSGYPRERNRPKRCRPQPKRSTQKSPFPL